MQLIFFHKCQILVDYFRLFYVGLIKPGEVLEWGFNDPEIVVPWPLKPAGRKTLEGQVAELMAALLGAARSKLSPEVRTAALKCLAGTMALPYNLLYPLKAEVVDTLAQAVDDPKRLVRMQAAKTRRLWCPV
jgi:hypothetical protein